MFVIVAAKTFASAADFYGIRDATCGVLRAFFFPRWKTARIGAVARNASARAFTVTLVVNGDDFGRTRVATTSHDASANVAEFASFRVSQNPGETSKYDIIKYHNAIF